MSPRISASSPLAFSLGLYRLLLFVYPREFREVYGPHMLQVFRDRCRERARESGTAGLMLWWAVTLVDFIGSVVEQHLRKEHYMTRTALIRLSGWALILAAAAYLGASAALPQAERPPYVGVWLLIFACVFSSIGTLGVIAQYGAVIKTPGKALLLGGALASFLMLTTVTEFVWEGQYGWMIPFAGPAIQLGTLAAFGLMMSRSKLLPTDVVVSLACGFWFVLLMLLGWIATRVGGATLWELTISVLVLGSFITAFALARLGWLMQSRTQINPALASP